MVTIKIPDESCNEVVGAERARVIAGCSDCQYGALDVGGLRAGDGREMCGIACVRACCSQRHGGPGVLLAGLDVADR